MTPLLPPPAPALPASIFLLGAGGLGCAAALALSGLPGIRLTIADPDRIAISNLHRQILYSSGDIDACKVEKAANRLKTLSSPLEITPLVARLDTPEAIAGAARGHGALLDATDNFPTRFAANDAAIRLGIPLVHGAATALAGQLLTILPGRSACLRCLFGGPPPLEGPTCVNAGVLGPLVGEVGWLMAMETVKLHTGTGQLLINRLLTIHALTGRRRAVPLRPNPRCPCHHQPGPATP
ncbi:MAG: HesA/MoeB/ThiF family protein [Magnetococcales bacterium]|nr:HesA/MoeB/ThiF family protein [Magnetococcales bacterium]